MLVCHRAAEFLSCHLQLLKSSWAVFNVIAESENGSGIYVTIIGVNVVNDHTSLMSVSVCVPVGLMPHPVCVLCSK
jgi:hypothetical protein